MMMKYISGCQTRVGLNNFLFKKKSYCYYFDRYFDCSRSHDLNVNGNREKIEKYVIFVCTKQAGSLQSGQYDIWWFVGQGISVAPQCFINNGCCDTCFTFYQQQQQQKMQLLRFEYCTWPYWEFDYICINCSASVQRVSQQPFVCSHMEDGLDTKTSTRTFILSKEKLEKLELNPSLPLDLTVISAYSWSTFVLSLVFMFHLLYEN